MHHLSAESIPALLLKQRAAKVRRRTVVPLAAGPSNVDPKDACGMPVEPPALRACGGQGSIAYKVSVTSDEAQKSLRVCQPDCEFLVDRI
jgi:hypothetical protein